MQLPAAAAFLAAAVSFGTVGCGTARVRAGGDRALYDRIAALESERDELRTALAEAESEVWAARTAAGDAPEAARMLARLPRPVELKVVRSPRLRDLDGDGEPDVVRVNVRPLDERGRFVQAAGRLDLAVTAIAAADGAVVELGRLRATSEQVRDAYVDGFGPASYLFEIPVDGAMLRTVKGAVTVLASLDDVRRSDPVDGRRRIPREPGVDRPD